MSSIPPIFADGFGDVAPGEVCVGCGARVEHGTVLCADCQCEGRTADEPPADDDERAWLAAITCDGEEMHPTDGDVAGGDWP